MHILLLHPSIIPPKGYGGLQRILFWLAQSLAASGHKVTVMAAADSTIDKLIPGVKLIPFDLKGSDYRTLIPRDVDVIHFFHSPPADMLPNKPYIVRIGGNDRGNNHVFVPNTVFVSRSHARNHNASLFVYNGIPKENYPVSLDKQGYMLFLAKLGWRLKNARTAINLSLDSGMPLTLTGGKMWREHKVWGMWLLRRFFSAGIISNAGIVSGDVKLRLLQNASALFYLVNWHEPCANAVNEALSCGTPILVTPNGALPEYIEDGKNGFIVSNYREALEAIYKLKNMSDKELRDMSQYAHDTVYSVENMTNDYIRLYEIVMAKEFLYPPEDVKRFRYDPPPHVTITRP